jgi:Calcineurin-like phosphoesterase
MKASKLLIFLCTVIFLTGLCFAPGKVIAVGFPGPELLGRPTGHSVTVNVVADAALQAYLEYGTSPGVYDHQTNTVNSQADEPIVAVIDGLASDTKYYYRMVYSENGGSTWTERDEHSFRTQRPPGETFVFTVTSDSHVDILLGQPATWQQTLTNVANDHPDFHLDLGDTFAMDNVSSEAGARSAYLFQRSASFFGLIGHSAPIFLAVGNHEQEEGWHLGDNANPANTPPVWGTNARKRYFLNPVPDDFYSGNTDTYYAIDGNQLHEDYYAWTWGDALFVVLDPFWYTTTKPFMGNTGGGEPGTGSGDRWDWTLGDNQYNWLKETLENSNAKYKFLFMHHPTGGTDDYIRGGAAAGTYCEWGGYNEDGITWGFTTRRPGWSEPVHQVLIDNHVSAVFHGHDHQFAYEIRDGIVYQELPAAGFSGNGFNDYATGQGYTIKALPSPGHLRVTVAPSQTTVAYVQTNGGGVAYSYTIDPHESVNTCQGDIEPLAGDGDVDGSDLAEYISNPGGINLEDFAANFGRTNCPSS